MNKSKEKRIRKDIDKLLSGGRYWEWLEKVQESDLKDHYRKEWDDVWQLLAKQALRHPERLQEFWSNCAAIKSHPEIADIKLLFGLRGFIYDDAPPEGLILALMNIKGLSMPADELRKRVMTWKDDTFPQKKLTRLLKSFCSAPDKILKRHFVSLAQLLEGTNLAKEAENLAEHIAYINRLGTNTTTKVKNDKLSEIDEYLSDIHEELPPDLAQILFYPFVVNLMMYLNRLARGGNTETVANCVSKMPFLFALSVGQKGEQIRDSISNVTADVLDDKHIEKKISGADLQGKVALIRKLRQLIMDAHPYSVKRYAGYLRTLYRNILAEVSHLQQTVSDREKRAVSNLLGREIVNDLPFLWDTHRELSEFLLLLGQSGYLNAKLSVLGMALSEHLKNRRLMELSEGVLKGHHTSVEDELVWLFDNFEDMVFPHVSNLRPLVNLFGEQEGFNNKLHEIVMNIIRKPLFINTISHEFMPGDSFFDRMLPFEDILEDIKTLKSEIANMKNYKPFLRIWDYLDCFSDNYYSEKGVYCLFDKMYNRDGIRKLLIEFEDLVSRQNATANQRTLFDTDLKPYLLKIHKGAFLKFIQEHWDDLRTIEVDSLQRLSTIILDRFPSHNILIRFYNLLEERHQAGETALEDLLAKISSKIRKAVPAKAPKTRQRRKR
ncbi:MAG: hypothetical protein HQL02_01595 [Nitrospirae bacterium]|nr:hypothetical protein [Nitrospirota bacterium]